MDSNAIQIAVRVRPFHAEKEEPYVIRQVVQPFFLGDGAFTSSPRKQVTNGSIRQVIDVCDDRMLDFDKPELGAETKRGQVGAKRYKNRKYLFDHVLGMEATQEDVFRRTAFPLLEGILTGYNATIFAYGATGCGKTHTISGTPENPGVIVRTTAELFRMMAETKDDFDTHIELSMVEIYNETIRDLLSDDFPACPVGGLRLLENEKNRVTVGGVTLKRPTNVEEVMNLVMMGNSRRSTSFTAMNSQSSRSHAVLQMNIGRSSKGHDINVEESVVRQCLTSATLSIIDLAGSERAAATQNMGARMKEGANINKSLLALSSCISALCQRPLRGIKPHVPYRNSKLTRMLKFSLGGNCRTCMIVCVSPSSKDLEDTYNTLVWADKAKNVSTKISRNTAGVDVRSAQYIEALARKEQEIKDLKATIARMEAGEKSYHDRRRDLERADIERTIAELIGQVDGAMPAILAGAGFRAGWDGAELLVAALKSRANELDDTEDITYVNSLVHQQCARYQNNPEAANAIRKEQATQSTITNILRNAETRKFGDTADQADLEGLRLNIALKQQEMQCLMLETREKAYREAVQKHAMALANVSTVLRKIQGGLGKQEDKLRTAGQGAVADVLADLAGQSTDALAALFSKAAGGDLPPLPQVSQLGEASASVNGVSPFRLALSPPSTTSFSSGRQPRASIFDLPERASRPGIQQSPAGLRLINNRGGASGRPAGAPRSARRYGSPIKAKPKSTVVKTLRFAEEHQSKYITASEAETSDSSYQDITGSEDADEAGDEFDVHETADLPGSKKSALSAPAARSAGLAGRTALTIAPVTVTSTSSSNAPAPTPAPSFKRMLLPGQAKKRLSVAPRSGPTPLAQSQSQGDSSDSSKDGIIPPTDSAMRLKRPGPSRFMMNNSLVPLDENESSPESGGPLRSTTSSHSGMGPPARAPLNERKSVPGGNTSIGSPTGIPGLPSSSSNSNGNNASSTSSFSSLYRPTQSSLGKVSGGGASRSRPSISALGLPSASTFSGERKSSTGPVRNERQRTRASLAPGFASRSGGGIGGSGDSFMGNPGPGLSFNFSGLSAIAASPGANLPGSADINGDNDTDSSSSSSPTTGTRPPSTTAPPKFNPLSAGAQRLTAPTQSSLNRRNSVNHLSGLAGTNGVSRGPRASVSMAQLPKTGGPRGSLMPNQASSRFR